MTKMEAVRQVMAEFGKEIKPLQIRDVLKERFNIDISPDVASNYKKELIRRASGKKRRKKGKRGRAAAVAQAAPSAPVAAAGKKVSGTITPADVRAVRDLVDRVGAATLRDLLEAMT
jgi:hypothetical protein